MAVRMIDGNELVKRLENIMTKHVDEGASAQGYGLAEAIDVIDDMPVLDLPNQRVSIKDRLPEEEQKEAYKWFEKNICSTAMPGAREAYQVALVALGPVSLEEVKRACDHCKWKYCRPPEEKKRTPHLEGAKNGWVSVEERRPEINGLYYVYKSDKTIDFSRYWYGKWLLDCDYSEITPWVTHWMPKPAPPTED